MNPSWAPLWSNVVDSSLWCEPDFVIKVFITMLVKKDANHVVWGNAFNIGQWARKDEAEVLKALKILSSPDKRRIEPQPFEGRRIQKCEGGWLILNADKYRAEISKLKRREYKRIKQAEYRAKEREALTVQARNDSNSKDFVAAEGARDTKGMDAAAAKDLPGSNGG